MAAQNLVFNVTFSNSSLDISQLQTISADYELVFAKVFKGDKGDSPVWGKITGTLSDQADLDEALGGKVDKVEGKGLSTNDYDATEKQKVADAYADKHTHANKAELDLIASGDKAKWDGKQDAISDLAAIRSNASAGKTASDNLGGHTVGEDVPAGLSGRVTQAESDIDTIEGKIPSAASSGNQLADKAFVNSSISTSAATFRGTVTASDDTEAAAQTALAAITTKDNNDYANVMVADTPQAGADKYKRYTYNGSSWEFNFAINTTEFTAAQWAALNSGATAAQITAIGNKVDKVEGSGLVPAAKVSAYDSHLTNTSNPHGVTKSQIGLGNVDNTSDANKPISSAAQAALDAKADIEDLEDGTIIPALAENIDGKQYEDNACFIRRTTGSHFDIESGAAELMKVKGRSVVWNQLFRLPSSSVSQTINGVTITDNRDGSYTINGTATAEIWFYPVGVQCVSIVGHKYLTKGCPSGGDGSTYILLDGNGIAGADVGQGVIRTANLAGNIIIGIVIRSGVTVTDLTFTPQLYDLTLMFGAGNEPATVAEFEALYPLDYYSYNAGQVLNNCVTDLVTDGFNQLNSSTGKFSAFAQQYQITGTYTAITQDGSAITPDSSGFFTPAAGEVTVTGYDSTTCVHLVWSGIRNGETEAWWRSKLSLNVRSMTGKVGGGSTSETIFPYGMVGVGTAYDELTANADNQITGGVRRFARRAYQSGDESDTTVITDGSTYTFAPLATAETFVLDTPVSALFRVDDFGTEQADPIAVDASGNPQSAPFCATIQYGINVADTVKNLPVNYVRKADLEVTLANYQEKITPTNKLDASLVGITVVTTNPATLEANKLYDLGEQSSLALVLPATASLGDFIIVDFLSGSTATTLSITSTAGMSEFDLVPEANMIYSILAEWIKIDASTYGWGLRYLDFEKAS